VSLNKYSHRSVHSSAQKDQESQGRSIKSEYDYGSKRKFVDVIGNNSKTKEGLRELVEFEKKLKDMDGTSQKSQRLSLAGSAHRRIHSTLK